MAILNAGYLRVDTTTTQEEIVPDLTERFRNELEVVNVGIERKQEGINYLEKGEAIDIRGYYKKEEKSLYDGSDDWRRDGRGIGRASEADAGSSRSLKG